MTATGEKKKPRGKRKRRVYAIEEASREIDFRDLQLDFIRKREAEKRRKRRRNIMIAIMRLLEEGFL